MIKRDIVETIYEYDTAGNLVRKTVTETHEEDTNVVRTESPHVYEPYPYHNSLMCDADMMLLSTTTAKNNN